MNHPVAGIIGDELDGASLRDADQDGVVRSPGGLRLAAAFGAGDCELMAVHVDGVMVHAEIDEAEADAIAEADD